jgi:hypothetical protein
MLRNKSTYPFRHNHEFQHLDARNSMVHPRAGYFSIVFHAAP